MNDSRQLWHFVPFHESVAAAIDRATFGEMGILQFLLLATQIPANHDEIVRSWNARCLNLRWGTLEDRLDVVQGLEVQQQKAIEQAGRKQASVDLDQLSGVISMLRLLLLEREPGLEAWHGSLQHNLERLRKLIG